MDNEKLLETLTEEERAALEEEGDALDEVDEDEAAEGDTAAASPDGERVDDSGEGESQEEAEDEETKDVSGPAPLLAADAPADADEKLAEIARQKEELVQKFEDGDLTAKEYQLELDKLAKQEREIEQAQFKAKLAQEMAEQQARNAWLQTVNQFLDEHKEYRQFPLRYKALDIAVRELAAKEENQGLSGREILEKAHAQIVEQFGLVKGEQKPESKREIKAPPTLAKVPASAATETENGRWARLDRLMETDPIRYEMELAKLPEEEREAYLSQ